MWTSTPPTTEICPSVESDRVFDQQNSELVSQNAGYKPSNACGVVLRVRVRSQLADRTQVVCRDTSEYEEKSQN